MSSRYNVARAKGRAHYEKVIDEDKALLEEFGARLLSVHSGVRVALEKDLREEKIHPWNIRSMDGRTWEWIRPLLEELLAQRAATRIAAN